MERASYWLIGRSTSTCSVTMSTNTSSLELMAFRLLSSKMGKHTLEISKSLPCDDKGDEEERDSRDDKTTAPENSPCVQVRPLIQICIRRFCGCSIEFRHTYFRTYVFSSTNVLCECEVVNHAKPLCTRIGLGSDCAPRV